MASRKLTIVDQVNNFNMNIRYENASAEEKPEVIAKAPNGKQAWERSIFDGQVLVPGSTTKQWVDADGNVHDKATLTFWIGDEQVSMVEQTRVFTIAGYDSISDFNNRFHMDKFYSVEPADNDEKKDVNRALATQANLFQLRRLWEHLKKTNTVARSDEFNTSSRGFMPGVGYVRAVEDGAKWGLEIGLFKAEKALHLFDTIPTEAVPPAASAPVAGGKKLKFVIKPKETNGNNPGQGAKQ